jgi:hypothetical protein
VDSTWIGASEMSRTREKAKSQSESQRIPDGTIRIGASKQCDGELRSVGTRLT